MNENKEIEEAMNELQEMSKDEELRRVAELREKAIRDEQNGLRHAKEEGIREGIEQVAKRMINLNHSIEDIMQSTGLNKEEILSIKRELEQ